MWQCVVVCGSVLQCVAVCCSVWQCVAVCGRVWQCVAVCVWQCVAVCGDIVDTPRVDKFFVCLLLCFFVFIAGGRGVCGRCVGEAEMGTG